MSQELLDLGIEPNHSVTVRAVGVRYLQGRKAESLFDTDFLKNEIVLEHAFRELLGRLGVPAGQEESVIVYVHPYDQVCASPPGDPGALWGPALLCPPCNTQTVRL